MVRQTPNNAMEITLSILKILKKEINTAVDLTFGKGNDSRKILELFSTKIYCFDIQKNPLEIYGNELKKDFPNSEIILINDDHANIDLYVDEEVDLAIYNLGYLPGFDKNIHTNSSTTLKSLKKLLEILSVNGVIFIVFYPGFESGMEEKERLFSFLKDLDQKKYAVLIYDFINQINNPPILATIERLI